MISSDRKRSIWIGFDPREKDEALVAKHSIERRLSKPIPVNILRLDTLIDEGIYGRPTVLRNGKLYDTLSERADYDGEISTEFAISRFFVPHLAGVGWALFLDCDMLVRCDLNEVFDICERGDNAVYCVQHDYQPVYDIKMDGRRQTAYPCKNWSSFVVFDCEHWANGSLTIAALQSWPGRDLHAFKWVDRSFIGALAPTYNHLVGDVPHDDYAKVVHFTNGPPSMRGFEDCPFADEWRRELARARRRGVTL